MKGRKIFWLVVGLGLGVLVAFHLGCGLYQTPNPLIVMSVMTMDFVPYLGH
jgi:hypothetical protein